MPSKVQSFRDERRHEKYDKETGDDRTPAQRDRDRLLYSASFQRLAEVTQVVSASSGYVFHNRLTHSLQVAQVGRRLAEKLLLNPEFSTREDRIVLDPDTVEAACLAHDLGHPPFGHVVEEELNDLSEQIGGFEGNAQSFRILSNLAFRSYDHDGMDLTRSTLCAVLKYPWLRGENTKKPRKWGAYTSEKPDYYFARELYPLEFEQNPDAYLMDWADDITYSVHDLEDFYRAGRIPLHLLSDEGSQECEYFFNDVFQRHTALGNAAIVSRRSELQEAFTAVLIANFAPTEGYRGTMRQRAGLRRFTGSLIGRYINGVTVSNEGGNPYPFVKPQYRDEVLMLKELTWTYVIQDPGLASQQVGQRHMIRKIYEIYANASQSSRDWRLFPEYYRERLDRATSNEDRLRACVDLLAGMTETQVHRIFNRLTGNESQSSLIDPLR
jgi:dGTPase